MADKEIEVSEAEIEEAAGEKLPEVKKDHPESAEATKSESPEAEDEEPEHSTADYEKYEIEEKTRSPLWGKLLKISLIILIIAGLATAGYWFLKNHKSTKSSNTPTSGQSSQATSSSSTNTIDTTTKHYTSTNFTLSLDYPANWVVVDKGGGIMTITSPDVQVTGTDDKQIKGTIVLTIRNKSQKLTEFDSGNAQAALASVKITYTNPAPGQRGSTYESFLRYATTTSSNGLDGIYITGDTGYQVNQAIPAADFVPVEPIISITFIDSSGKALTIATSNWSNPSFSGPLQKMLESLAIS